MVILHQIRKAGARNFHAYASVSKIRETLNTIFDDFLVFWTLKGKKLLLFVTWLVSFVKLTDKTNEFVMALLSLNKKKIPEMVWQTMVKLMLKQIKTIHE